MIEAGRRREHRTTVVARHEGGRLVWRARCREPECEYPPRGWHVSVDDVQARAAAELDARHHALYPTGAAVITSLRR